MSVLDDFVRMRLYRESASEFKLLAETEPRSEVRLRYRIIARHYRELMDRDELGGEDLRRRPLEERKRRLAKLVRGPHPGIVLNEIFEGDGDILFEHACKLGCEGIVSKRLGYRSGRSAHWVKVKNPKAPAVKREAEEDWGR